MYYVTLMSEWSLSYRVELPLSIKCQLSNGFKLRNVENSPLGNLSHFDLQILH